MTLLASSNLPVVPQGSVRPDLSDIPETMLWTLHERATEAKRHNGLLHDPWCLKIYEALEYDFVGHFGAPKRLAAVRSAQVDRALRRWLSRHPTGLVVALGEGLETQALRVDNGSMQWLSIDLPEALKLRERLLPPSDRFRHLAMSAFDPNWMDRVDHRPDLFIVAQGLFMYFSQDIVRSLFCKMADRLPGAELIFDTIPRWVSEVDGHKLTPNYTSPAMPWGLNRGEIEQTLRSWFPDLDFVRCRRFREPNGRPDVVERLLDVLRPRRRESPTTVHVRFPLSRTKP